VCAASSGNNSSGGVVAVAQCFAEWQLQRAGWTNLLLADDTGRLLGGVGNVL
jgi:hypothetical protein